MIELLKASSPILAMTAVDGSSFWSAFKEMSDKHIANVFGGQDNTPLLCCSKIGCEA